MININTNAPLALQQQCKIVFKKKKKRNYIYIYIYINHIYTHIHIYIYIYIYIYTYIKGMHDLLFCLDLLPCILKVIVLLKAGPKALLISTVYLCLLLACFIQSPYTACWAQSKRAERQREIEVGEGGGKRKEMRLRERERERMISYECWPLSPYINLHIKYNKWGFCRWGLENGVRFSNVI